MDLGDATLRLTVDQRGLDKGLDQAHRQTVGWTGKVRNSLSSISGDFKKSILAGVGIGAGISAFGALTGAISGVTNAIGDMVKSAVEDEQSIARLTASLEANVAGFDGNTEAIEENIKAAQRLGFADDELRASMTFLVAATHDVGEATRIQAVAMDLARFKGISLQAATEALVKVEAGQFRVLKSLGIVLEEGATQTEALAAVQAVASGQAEEFADTTAGAMLAAEIAMEEAGEALGTALLPLIQATAEFVRDDLAPALEDLAGWFQTAGSDLRAFNVDLYNATGGLLGFSQAVATDKDQSDSFLETLDDLPASVRAVGDAIGGEAGSMFSPIPENAEAAADEAVAIVRRLPGEIAKAMRDGQRDVESGVELLTDLMTDEWTDQSREQYYLGILNSQQLADGLAHGDADVRDASRELQQTAQNELYKLQSGAYDAGADGGGSLGSGITSAKTTVGQRAAALAQHAKTNLTIDASTVGYNVGLTYSAGLTLSQAKVIAAASGLRTTAWRILQMANSPPYTLALEAGEGVGMAWAHGIGSAVPAAVHEAQALTGAVAGTLQDGLGTFQPPALAGTFAGLGQGVAGAVAATPMTGLGTPLAPSGGDTIITNNYNIEIEGRAFGTQNPEDLLPILRSLAVG